MLPPKVTWADKSQTDPYDPSKFNASDANTLKAALNALIEHVATLGSGTAPALPVGELTVSNAAPSPGASILVTVLASAAGSSVASVVVRNGATVLGNAIRQGLTNTWLYTWQNVPAGEHSLTALVTSAAGQFAPSPAVPVTAAATVTPTAPSPVTQLDTDTTAGNGQVTVAVEPPASNGAAIQSYRYEYRAGTSGSWLVAGTTANLSYTITGLTNGVSYQFRAFATNSAGTSTAGAVVTATPTAGAGSAGYADVVMFVPGQSNDSGLSPISGLPTEYKTADSRVKIWNHTATAVQTYQVGVNDNPLTPALVPGYERGFGPDAAFVKAWRDDPANIGKQLFLFKKDVTPPQSTNSATCAFWQSDIYPAMKQEWDAYKAALQAQGYTVRVALMVSGLGEGDAGNSNFLSEYTALVNRFETEITGVGVRKLIAKKQHAAPNNAAAQAQYVAAHSEATLVDLPSPAFLSDGLHYTADSMIRLGALHYSVWSGSYTPPPPPPPPVEENPGPTFSPWVWGTQRDYIRYENQYLYSVHPTSDNYQPSVTSNPEGVPFGNFGGVKATVIQPVDASVKSIYFILGVSETDQELPEFQMPWGVQAFPGTNSGFMLKRILAAQVGEGSNNAPFADNIPYGTDISVEVDNQGAIVVKKRLAGASWVQIKQLGNVTGKAYFQAKVANYLNSGIYKPMSYGLV